MACQMTDRNLRNLRNGIAGPGAKALVELAANQLDKRLINISNRKG